MSPHLEGNALLDRVQSEEAQQLLSRLMFERAGPELLYPVEWWAAFIRSHQKKEELVSLLREFADAERSRDAERLVRLSRRKTGLKRELEEIKREMMKVSVYGSGKREGGDHASLLTEIAAKELAKAELAGDAKLVGEWRKRLAGRIGT